MPIRNYRDASSLGRPRLMTGKAMRVNVIDPISGILYAARASGTYTWSLIQPTSPQYMTQMRGGFRVQDISSDGLGTVHNGWEWRLQWQRDNTWQFTWYSVTGGTAAAAIHTVNNIGTVTNVRVTLSGTSISMETSANNGASYTARGSTTSASYQTQTGYTVSYTGATGSNLAPTPEFDNWSGGAPVGWTKENDNGTTRVISQVGAGVGSGGGGTGSFNIYNADASVTIQMYTNSSVLSVNGTYIYITNVSFNGSTRETRLGTRTGVVVLRIEAGEAGIRAGRQALTGMPLQVSIIGLPGAIINTTLDWLQIFRAGVLDASGDGKFTRLS